MKHPTFCNRPPENRFKRRSHSGFTLTELAIVLAIAGIIFGAIWAAATSVSENNRVDQAYEELQTVAQNMVTLYQARTLPVSCDGAGSSNMTGNAIGAVIIPPTWVNSGFPDAAGCQTARNPWNSGAVTPPPFIVYANAMPAFPSVAVNPQNFRASFYNVPEDGCIALLMRATGCDPSQPDCPIAVMTNDAAAADYLPINAATPFTPSSYPAGGWQGVLTLTEAETLCATNALPNEGSNSVEFDFKL